MNTFTSLFSSKLRNSDWLATGCTAALAFLLATVLLLSVDLPAGSLFWSAVQNSGHTLVFAVLTVICLVSVKSRAGTVTNLRFGLIIGCLALFSCLIEYAQSWMAREASIDDMLLNAAGVVVGVLIFCAVTLSDKSRRLRSTMMVLAVLILTFNFRLPIRYAVANILQPPLPVLADFEYLGATSKIEANWGGVVNIVNNTPVWRENRSKYLEVKFPAGQWPGFTLLELHPDWTGYSELNFEVFNPSERTVEVTIRVHDDWHNNEYFDRYNQRLSFKPGADSISIPLESVRLAHSRDQQSRQLDMKKIRALKIFVTTAPLSDPLFFDNFHLK